jgi:hypothetical protein
MEIKETKGNAKGRRRETKLADLKIKYSKYFHSKRVLAFFEPAGRLLGIFYCWWGKIHLLFFARPANIKKDVTRHTTQKV